MLHHDVITIVAIFTIVASDHNCRNTNHNCRKKTQLLQSCSTTIVCRNANRKCRNLIYFLLFFFFNINFV